jgi:hypothetical protein
MRTHPNGLSAARIFCAFLLVLTALFVTSRRFEAVSGCDPSVNPIVCENQLTGNASSEWDLSGGIGDSNIQGFATSISVNKGETEYFKVDTNAATFSLDIYRLGYYGGMGARKVATLSNVPGKNQPNCLTDGATGLVDCGNWSVSAGWTVPTTATSGIYIAKIKRTGTSTGSHIAFIVRDDTAHAPVLFQTSDTTWQAYNTWGGNSLYVGGPGMNPGRAYKVSYNRPFTTRETSSVDWLFNAEYPMVRFLESNGYNVSYISGADVDRIGATELKRHTVFLSVGHDEYWSGGQRSNVEAARDAGVNLAFLSGNEVYWKTRWETSIDGSGTGYRTLVCYKETHNNGPLDPMDPPTWTGTWRDPRFSPPADGGRPENALTGTLFTVNYGGTGSNTWAITVPQTYSKLSFWRNTRVATLASGATATLAAGTLGYEWDENVNNGSRPSGLVALSSTTKSVAQKLLDYGSTYGAASATHVMTLYHPSTRTTVFGGGTAQFTWGLDGHHDNSGSGSTPDLAMQQSMVNLFFDMNGVEPATMQSGLVSGGPSDARPSVNVTAPSAGATVSGVITLSATASDDIGVSGVQFKIDGAAVGNEDTAAPYSMNWTTSTVANGNHTVTATARDTTGHYTTSVVVNITVANAVQTCPCSIWNSSATPGAADPDTSSQELGVKFTSEAAGFITGVKFYKYAANTGTHIGNLWNTAGQLLGSATFTNETASGWQQATFATPIAINANTTYIASYFTPVGHYASSTGEFLSGVDNPPLHALSDNAGGGNGVYAIGASTTFPNQSWSASNYWVDVVFTPPSDTTPPTVSAVTPTSGATGVATTATVTARFNESMKSTSFTSTTFVLKTPSNMTVAATLSYDNTTFTETLTPNAALANGTTYTATISGGAGGVTDASGNALAANYSWSFTTVAADTTPPTVSAVSPPNGATGVATTTAVTAQFSEAMKASTITTASFVLRDPSNMTVSATMAYNTSTFVATLTPSAPLANSTTYTATVTTGVTDAAGNTLASNFMWSFTTVAPAGCPCSIWSAAATPGSADPDTGAQELGVKFTSDINGYITGIRFYKWSTNTGTHVGNLWDSSGTKLATVTFTSESASGWQQATFSSPVPITAGTTYVASYHTNVGHYASSEFGLTSAVNSPPLHALSDGSSGGNGVYALGASSVFPASSWNGSNYWVDVIFTQ